MLKRDFNKKFFYISLCIYVLLLLWVIIFKWTNYNAVTISINNFRGLTLRERFDFCMELNLFWDFDLKDVCLNALLFLPLGGYYLIAFNRENLVIWIGLLLSLCFEVSQFFSSIGMFNLFDILANFLGTLIGFGIYLIYRKFVSGRVINIINIAVIIMLLPLCVYAIYMTVANFDIYIAKAM